MPHHQVLYLPLPRGGGTRANNLRIVSDVHELIYTPAHPLANGEQLILDTRARSIQLKLSDGVLVNHYDYLRLGDGHRDTGWMNLDEGILNVGILSDGDGTVKVEWNDGWI